MSTCKIIKSIPGEYVTVGKVYDVTFGKHDNKLWSTETNSGTYIDGRKFVRYMRMGYIA